MALDKLVDGAQLDSDLGDIADAIRAKGGTSAELEFPNGFVSAVQAIPTGTTPTGTINIISNGTYDVTDKATANVNVPGITPTGTKQISITQNGTTTEDVAAYANAEITVNVQGSGGYNGGDFADNTKPVGAVTVTASYFAVQNNAGAPNYMQKRTGITSLYLPNYNNTANQDGTFRDCTAMQYFVAPKLTVMYNTILYGCTNLLAIDWLGGSITGSKNHFVNCTKLGIMVIRRTASICSLATTGAFNTTKFASGKAGGTLYVPQALIESYQAATNWSTILGYANNQILPIEGSIYETQYVDGTPIPTT